MSPTPSLDVQRARAHFPSLESGYIFADSAGGSQAIKAVADAAYDYLLNTNAQLGAAYPVAHRATQRVAHGADAAAVLFNATSRDEVAFGSSTSQLLANLALAMAPLMREGDEIIVTGEHEANVSPWTRLAASRKPPLPLHTWAPTASNPKNPCALSYTAALPALTALLSPRTRIVAFPACSNILGEIVDVAAIVKAVRAHAPAAHIVVDLVAYAPHRAIDVRAWDVDFAVFSFYKLYGPHTAALYTRPAALAPLAYVNHHFHAPRNDALPFKLQLGGPGYELTYSAAAVLPYLVALAAPAPDADSGSEALLHTRSHADLRTALEHTSALFAAHESTLTAPLLAFLTSARAYARGVRVVGPETGGVARAPTVSFVVVGPRAMGSRDVVEQVDKLGTIGIRWGHFYAYALVRSVVGGGDVEDGVVRVSLVHYHTVGDVEKIVRALEGVLFAG